MPMLEQIEAPLSWQRVRLSASAASDSRAATRVLWGIIVLALLLRVPLLDRPLLGSFATKNATYAMIARNWIAGRATLDRPTTDCLCGGERGWHLTEIPVMAYVAGSIAYLCGGSLDAWGRATAILFSLLSIGLLYQLVERRAGATAAAGAAFVLATAPVSIIFGQSFMLESSVVAFTLATLLGAERWLCDGRRRDLLLVFVSFALLLLSKVYMLVLGLPLLVLIVQHRRSSTRRTSVLAATLLLATLPTLAWVVDVLRVSERESLDAPRVFYSLLNSAEAYASPQDFLRSAGFYRRLLDDLAGVVLGPIGVALLVLGVTCRNARGYWPWVVAMLVLMLAMPRKFYELNYYHLVTLPPLAILAGLGYARWVESWRPQRGAVALLIGVSLLFSLRHAITPAFITPEEDRSVLAAAAAVQELTKPYEPVATIRGSTSALLYYCDRPGWALSEGDSELTRSLEQARQQGARWLVVAHPSIELQRQLSTQRMHLAGEDFAIYALTAAGSSSP